MTIQGRTREFLTAPHLLAALYRVFGPDRSFTVKHIEDVDDPEMNRLLLRIAAVPGGEWHPRTVARMFCRLAADEEACGGYVLVVEHANRGRNRYRVEPASEAANLTDAAGHGDEPGTSETCQRAAREPHEGRAVGTARA